MIVSGAAAYWSNNELITHSMAMPFVYFEGFDKFNDARFFDLVYKVKDNIYIYQLID